MADVEKTIRSFIQNWMKSRDPDLSAEEKSNLKMAFNEEYLVLYSYIGNIIHSRFGRQLSEKIDDISHDIIEKMLISPQLFQQLENLKAYFYKTVVNHCLDELRTRRTERLPEEEDIRKKHKKGPEEDRYREEDSHLVRITLVQNVVPALSDTCVELLMGTCLGKTIAQIKSESKQPQSIHHPKMVECRELLKDLLEKHGLVNVDQDVLAKYLCEALEKFSNPE